MSLCGVTAEWQIYVFRYDSFLEETATKSKGPGK